MILYTQLNTKKNKNKKFLKLLVLFSKAPKLLVKKKKIYIYIPIFNECGPVYENFEMKILSE